MLHPAFRAALLALFPVAVQASAQQPIDPAKAPGRSPVAVYQDPAAAPGPPRAWQQFCARAGGQWRAEWCAATGTPHAIHGTGLPLVGWRENSLDEARRHAQLLMIEHAELLGLGTSEFREVIGSHMGRSWCLVYDQYFRGLPVIGGRADFRISMVGKVALFGSVAWPIPADFAVVPKLDVATATATAWTALAIAQPENAQPGQQRVPRLVIWGDIHAAARAPFALAWEIPVSAVDRNGDGPIGRYYIDAATGRVLHYENDKHECGIAGCTAKHHGTATGGGGDQPGAPPIPTQVTVLGHARLGTSATGPVSAIPMRGLRISVGGQAYTTDANGVATVDIAANAAFAANLGGIHSQTVVGPSAPTLTSTIVPGVPATLTFLSAGATVDEVAHTTVYAWTHSVNQFCRSILGNSPQLAALDNILPRVNIATHCNAYYDGSSINFYQAGSGCNNTAFSSVIAHEWGHGLDHHYGGISAWNGLGEAWADVVAMYLLDHAVIGENFTTNGQFIRTGDNTLQFPDGASFHEQGQSFMGFAWKLRQDLAVQFQSRAVAIQITNRIVLGSIVANAWNQPRAVLEVFVADDDDGNLANGTPHWQSLVTACNLHSLPIPWAMPPNDECANAITVFPGNNGPYDNRFATASLQGNPPTSGADLWFRYTTGAAGNLTVSLCGQANFDSILEVYSGTCGSLTSLGFNDQACGNQSRLTLPVGPGSYYIRVGSKVTPNTVPTQNGPVTIGWLYDAGPFQLSISGANGGFASATPFGTGCGGSSAAFYEHFPSNWAFDLSGTALRLQRVGDHYVASAQGSYVPPSPNATVLPLGDDDWVPVLLNGRFPVVSNPAGRSTFGLEVYSNGFVATGSGNSTAYVVNPADWLNSPAARWGTWHDFDPTRPGSGQVKFEQIGSIAYVTWDGVFSWGTSQRNFWQLQFDVATGNVTMAWLQMAMTGQPMLVGYAGVGPSQDLGSFDLSALLPAGFRIGGMNLPAPTLTGTPPRFGTTVALRTDNYPPSALFGVMCLGVTGYWPGIDLGSYGAPGCRQYTALEATNAMFPIGGSSTYLLTVPHAARFQGLPVHAQTFVLTPGANPLGLVVTNAIGMYVGS